jgi:type VI secretion system VasD/TssJ family lipoprotein
MSLPTKAIVLICFLFCSSCSKMPWSAPVYDPRYVKDAVTMNIKSDPRLNQYQERSHSLVLCMYELTEPNMFNQLSDERDGIYKLMECGRFDASVAFAKRQIVQPGVDVSSVMDRAEGVKYVGIAAGYYDLKKRGAIRMLPIKNTRSGKIIVDLVLGPQEIQDMRVR